MKKFLLILFLHAATLHFSQTLTVKTDLVYKVNLPSKQLDKPPVLILLHGYGSNESDLFDISKSVDERFLTFSLRAPYAARGQGHSWYALEYPDGKRTHDYQQAKISRNKILAFISEACRTYKADSTQVFIMGFSQGAIMCYDIALSKPEKIKGALPLSGLLMDDSKKIKTDSLKMKKVKFFIAHGSEDNIINFKEGENAAKAVKEKKAVVSFKSYPVAHSISGQELNDIKSWLKSSLDQPKTEAKKK
ncbi:MAG: phospholipase/Carboxylesterase [Bacteroidetes bacterium]|jgi:phospholipase/carboxylesterase|nr:phospholipase/Carboxylesterase [Bacteroidota bacterium]